MGDAEDINQALIDWREGRAYIDGQGNYHVKRYRHHSGPIAPWNKAAKQRFATVTDLHRVAFRKEAS